jgi:hypothetical protein
MYDLSDVILLSTNAIYTVCQQLKVTVGSQLSSPCHSYWMPFAASITPRPSLLAKTGKMPIRTHLLAVGLYGCATAFFYVY